MPDEKSLIEYLSGNGENTLEKMIYTLVGNIAGSDFIMQLTSPRQITSEDILTGNPENLNKLKSGKYPSEDFLWALNGTIEIMEEKAISSRGTLTENDLKILGNILTFIGLLTRRYQDVILFSASKTVRNFYTDSAGT